ncbi:hypothetical protein F7234_03725 [Pseudomonas putida]|uniref:hypothetical protein n=1 Tax=Pseudomonas putida TaxID=303 RepID=UPI00125EC1A8|nr:hypothetical protein [Pseudomonas putida]KAB5626257.1 hypothetical protein F7234_03725 [Pseudomonas putida]
MSTVPMTFAHEFHTQSLHSVFEAVGGIPVHESLDAATDRPEAVVAGLRELMQEPAVTHLATLIYFSAESALALVYSAHAGVDPEQGGAA